MPSLRTLNAAKRVTSVRSSCLPAGVVCLPSAGARSGYGLSRLGRRARFKGMRYPARRDLQPVTWVVTWAVTWAVTWVVIYNL